jgi:tRNA(fMet)-specific endonuclease VapC
MNLFYDTNILINLVRSSKTEELIAYFNPQNKIVYTSVVVEAEIKSIALANKWGKNRMYKLDYFLDKINILEVNQKFLDFYVEIDTFSQRKNPNFPTYAFATPRNMGKNDLWIASTATLLGLELVTTDADFAHLHNVFLEVRQINVDDLKQFF